MFQPRGRQVRGLARGCLDGSSRCRRAGREIARHLRRARFQRPQCLPAGGDHQRDDGAGRWVALAFGDVFLENLEVRDLPLGGFVLDGEL